ncbi:MAG: hypothetical protein ACOYMA_20530, partial [Bacteroidia bacterium]
MKLTTLIIFVLTIGAQACLTQTNPKMNDKNNPLFCDPVEGICGMDIPAMLTPIPVILTPL